MSNPRVQRVTNGNSNVGCIYTLLRKHVLGNNRKYDGVCRMGTLQNLAIYPKVSNK